jgi:signal recognition particle receptor subunit beta
VIDLTKRSGLPFIVAATKQDKPGARSVSQIRESLELPDDIKIVPCSAITDPDSARRALLDLLALLPQDHTIHHAQTALRAMSVR